VKAMYADSRRSLAGSGARFGTVDRVTTAAAPRHRARPVPRGSHALSVTEIKRLKSATLMRSTPKTASTGAR